MDDDQDDGNDAAELSSGNITSDSEKQDDYDMNAEDHAQWMKR